MSTSTQHYIRTIHTSFTATSSAWASSSTSHSQHWPSHTSGTYASHHHHYPSLSSISDGHKSAPSLGLGLGSGVGLGDWRSASGSPYTSARSKRAASRLYNQHSAARPAPPTFSRVTPASIKYQRTSFDPFYDEPLFPTTAMTTSPSSSNSAAPLSRRTATTSVSYASPRSQSGSTSSRVHTISIPPAPISTRPSTLTLDVLPSSAGAGSYPHKFISGFSSAPTERHRGSLVAGILLNRVHAVGKPMKRRPGQDLLAREYIKSGLSTVVSCAA